MSIHIQSLIWLAVIIIRMHQEYRKSKKETNMPHHALAVHWQFSILTLFKCIGISGPELLEVGKAGNFAGDFKGCVRRKD